MSSNLAWSQATPSPVQACLSVHCSPHSIPKQRCEHQHSPLPLLFQAFRLAYCSTSAFASCWTSQCSHRHKRATTLNSLVPSSYCQSEHWVSEWHLVRSDWTWPSLKCRTYHCYWAVPGRQRCPQWRLSINCSPEWPCLDFLIWILPRMGSVSCRQSTTCQASRPVCRVMPQKHCRSFCATQCQKLLNLGRLRLPYRLLKWLLGSECTLRWASVEFLLTVAPAGWARLCL